MRGTIEILDDEWARLSRSRLGARALATWWTREPTLSQYVTLDALARHGQDDATTDALARLAPTDPLAARALLRLVLPAVLSTGGAIPTSRVVDDLVALAWESIRAARRNQSAPAMNAICIDVRNRYRRLRVIESPRSLPLDDRDETARRESPSSTSPAPPGSDVATAALRDAFSDGAIGPEDFRLIVRTRLGGESLETFAAEVGVTTATLARRRRCAEQVLRARMARTDGLGIERAA